MRTRDQIEKTGHEEYMDSIYLVALSHINLGEWMEPPLAKKQVLKNHEVPAKKPSGSHKGARGDGKKRLRCLCRPLKRNSGCSAKSIQKLWK